jgi:hypothetical protein
VGHATGANIAAGDESAIAEAAGKLGASLPLARRARRSRVSTVGFRLRIWRVGGSVLPDAEGEYKSKFINQFQVCQRRRAPRPRGTGKVLGPSGAGHSALRPRVRSVGVDLGEGQDQARSWSRRGEAASTSRNHRASYSLDSMSHPCDDRWIPRIGQVRRCISATSVGCGGVHEPINNLDSRFT